MDACSQEFFKNSEVLIVHAAEIGQQRRIVQNNGTATAQTVSFSSRKYRSRWNTRSRVAPKGQIPSTLTIEEAVGLIVCADIGREFANGAPAKLNVQHALPVVRTPSLSRICTLNIDNLGLAGDHAFYFGNAVAEAGDSRTHTHVTTVDLLLARNNPHAVDNLAGIEYPYDYNRDQHVDTADVLLARNNQTD